MLPGTIPSGNSVTTTSRNPAGPPISTNRVTSACPRYTVTASIFPLVSMASPLPPAASPFPESALPSAPLASPAPPRSPAAAPRASPAAAPRASPAPAPRASPAAPSSPHAPGTPAKTTPAATTHTHPVIRPIIRLMENPPSRITGLDSQISNSESQIPSISSFLRREPSTLIKPEHQAPTPRSTPVWDEQGCPQFHQTTGPRPIICTRESSPERNRCVTRAPRMRDQALNPRLLVRRMRPASQVSTDCDAGILPARLAIVVKASCLPD